MKAKTLQPGALYMIKSNKEVMMITSLGLEPFESPMFFLVIGVNRKIDTSSNTFSPLPYYRVLLNSGEIASAYEEDIHTLCKQLT